METVKEMCGDNRFEVIRKAKKHLIEATNIDTSSDEMKVLDNFLFRAWQMGWLSKYDPTLQDATDTNVGNKWVSVDERLPTEEEISRAPFGRFLVSIFGVIFEAVYVNGYFAMSGGRLHSVSHWMNYPEPPKEVQ